MTKEAKAVKIASLVCLFVGVFVLGAGIFLLVQGGPTAGEGLCAAVGAATTVAGVQCARLANVPSNARSIRTLALAVLALGAAVAAAGYALKFAGTLEAALCAGAALSGLVLALLAHRLVKALERV